MSKMISAHLFSLDIGIDVLGPRQDNSNVIPFLIQTWQERWWLQNIGASEISVEE